MSVKVPYDWVKELPPSLLNHDSVPLFGHTPPFPWDHYQKSINDLFQTKGLTLRPSVPQWRSKEEIKAGIDHPTQLTFNVEPMKGSVHWLLSTDDISLLMSWLLAHTPEPVQTRQDPSLQEGFYRFLAIECCHLISTSQFDTTLTPKLVEEQPISDETALCIDIGIGYQNQEIRGRLVLSKEFHQSWKEYYANRSTTLSVPDALAEKVELTVRLEAGRVQLTKDEWTKILPGDFIILDFCSIQPPDNKGRVILVVNNIPLFRGKYKKGDIKILELPLFYEVDVPMAKKNPDESDELPNETSLDESQLSDMSLTDESQFDESHQETTTETSFAETDETSIADHTDTDEASQVDESTSEASISEGMETKKVDLNEIPLILKIEVGRLKMSVKKLLEIQAGNVLELDVHPEDGVDLVINGNCIGKGELIRVGEMLGVRVLDLLSHHDKNGR